jgi:hypothetical protein
VNPAVQAVLKHLSTNLETNRPRIDVFASFVVQLPVIPGDQTSKVLFVRAATPPSPILDSVKLVFEALLPQMYPWQSGKRYPFTNSDPAELAVQLASFSMFANTSSLNQLDVLSKTKISGNAMKCSNCSSVRGPATQKDPEFMAFVGPFKSDAPWKGFFESCCICGGKWEQR